jgi:hypothetical protein
LTPPPKVRPDHPVDALEFFLRAPSSEAAERFTGFLKQLADRTWLLGPPRLVDEKDEGSGGRNLGGVFYVYCGHAPWADRLATDVDAAQLREMRDLLQELGALSTEVGPLAVWFDGEEIAEVVDGQIDRVLQAERLQEWERNLDARIARDRSEARKTRSRPPEEEGP